MIPPLDAQFVRRIKIDLVVVFDHLQTVKLAASANDTASGGADHH